MTSLKPFLLFFFMFFAFSHLMAQMAEGYIQYEMRIDMHRQIPPDREEMKAMIPQYRTSDFALYFNSEQRLYKNEETLDAQPVQGGRGGGRMNMRNPRMEMFVSLENNERTVSMDFMGRNYLIIDTIKLAPWRLGNEFMYILDYRCQMAWYTDTVSGDEITAWFTVGIQPFLGPDLYSTLPGTILALDVNNGERVWIARKIVSRQLTAAEKRKPSRGEKISRSEFNKLMQEQRERMRSGGPMRF